MNHHNATVTLKTADTQVTIKMQFIVSLPADVRHVRSRIADHALAMLKGADTEFTVCDSVHINETISD